MCCIYFVIVFEMPAKAMFAATTAAINRVCRSSPYFFYSSFVLFFLDEMPAKTIDRGGGTPLLPRVTSRYIHPLK